MTEAHEYLRRAEHALEMMGREVEPQARVILARTAKAWLGLAEASIEGLASKGPSAALPPEAPLSDGPA